MRTAPGRLQRVVNHYRQQLADREAKAERTLQQAYAGVLRAIQPALDQLYQQMADKLANGEQIPLSWLYESGRLEKIKRLLSSQVNGYGALAQMMVGQILHQAVSVGQQAALAQLQASVPPGVSWNFGVPSPRALSELVGATQAGSPLADLFAGFGEAAAENVSGVLLRGLSLGENPREIARDVQQALDVPRARALTIARTEMNRAYRGANLETYRANGDVVKQWRWVADKSARTCAACLAMDGSLHDLSEDMGSHPNCRCTPAPVTANWEDLLSNAGIDLSGLDLEDTATTSYQSGEDWLTEQPEATQREVLGAKYQGWKQGDFALSDIVGHQHDPAWGHSIYEKSLKQLVKAR